jgi:hypothetical protein
MPLRYENDFRRIWKEHVPPSGQSNTVEGELVRAIEKLCDEALRNGNGNWDDGHERLLAYVRAKLLDPALFTPETLSQTAETLDLISDPDTPWLDPEPYDELIDRAIEYFYHYGSQAHPHDGGLHR